MTKKRGIFIYKHNNNTLLNSFDGLFTEHQSNHSHSIRNKGDYQFTRNFESLYTS